MRREFQRDKYKELVLYVVHKAGSLEHFGDILLNKILVDSDFTAYKELERPMTGQKVQHEAMMGPVSAALVPVRREMEEMDGSISLGWNRYGGYSQRSYKALRKPDMSAFTEAEVKIIDRCIDLWTLRDGTGASEESYRHFGGWVFTDMGEEIPYDTAYLSMRPLTQDAKDFANSLV